jgi:hypothetical protein
MKRKNSCKVMILTMLIRTMLREFLNRTGDYERFVGNLRDSCGVVRYLLSELSSPDGGIPNVINHAFLWSETPERHSYWSHLDITWREFVEKIFTSESLRDYFGISMQELYS